MTRPLEEDRRRLGPWPELRAEDLAAGAEALAQTYASVDAVYLFGSRARGEVRPGSDLDLAVLLSAPPPDRVVLEAEMARFLEDRFGLPVDVLVLRPELSPGLLFDVFRVERVLFARDAERAHRFACRARAEYRDLYPRLQRQFEHLRRQLKEDADALNRS